MNPEKIVFDIKYGDKFTFQFRKTKIVSVSTKTIIMEYTGKELATIKYTPKFPNGVLSVNFADFYKIKTMGLFSNLNNGFDFVIHPRMWIPYTYDNKKEPDNPLYSLQYKIKKSGFDTICINCHKKEVWVEIFCISAQGEELAIVLHDLELFY